MARVERTPRGKPRIWLDRDHEYIDWAFLDDDYALTITEDAARSLYTQLGEFFAENTNEG